MAVLFLQIFWLEKWNFLIFATSIRFSYFDCREVKIGNSNFLLKPVISILRLIFLIFSSKYWKLRFLLPLKVYSTSCSIRQYQCFFKSNVFWNIERLQCKSERGCSDKIRSHKKSTCCLIKKYDMKAQKDTCYFHISRGIFLARQARKIVHY